MHDQLRRLVLVAKRPSANGPDADHRPRVAVVGTVGVPARYGGFETLADALAREISVNELVLTVYCQKSAYSIEERKLSYYGHERVFLPLMANGPLCLLYDLLSILHAVLLRRCDVLICLGASTTLAFPLVKLFFPRRKIIFNVDGLEHKRKRWSVPIQTLLLFLEWLGIRWADVVISDNRGVRSLLHLRYRAKSKVIAYGGDSAIPGREVPPAGAEKLPRHFALAISRVVPENNVEAILDAFVESAVPLVYVGNWYMSEYGRKLRMKYVDAGAITLLEPIFDKSSLDYLRNRALVYIHGHSVGGTNPSLVEAVYWAPKIFAFDCLFNRATLDGCYCYWRNAMSLRKLLDDLGATVPPEEEDVKRLRARYSWHSITQKYCELIRSGICAGRRIWARPRQTPATTDKS